MEQQRFKISIGTTIVIVRTPVMADIENAMQVAGNRPGVNQYLFGLLFAKELLKATIEKVNDKSIKKIDLETIDKILTPGEIATCGKQLEEIMAMGEQDATVKLEVLTSGGN